MEFSRQEYWSGLSFPSPGDLPDLWIKPGSSVLQTDSFPSEPPEIYLKIYINYPSIAITQNYTHTKLTAIEPSGIQNYQILIASSYVACVSCLHCLKYSTIAYIKLIE